MVSSLADAVLPKVMNTTLDMLSSGPRFENL